MNNYVKDISFVLVLLFVTMLIYSCKNQNTVDTSYEGLSKYAKDLGLKEVAVNEDANSSEICYFIEDNGDTITLLGNKEEDGCVKDIYMMRYNTISEKINIRFDEKMHPIFVEYNNQVVITLEWQNDIYANVIVDDRKSNTYISTRCDFSNSMMYSTYSKSISKRDGNSKRTGELKFNIIEEELSNDFHKAPINTEDLSDQYCTFMVSQCDLPKDASTWISLSNAKNNKFIENIYYYKHLSTGKYLYRIPSSSYPSEASHQVLCDRIDWALSVLQTGLTWLAGFSSVADAISIACASTGIGVPPAAVLEAVSVATIAGAAGLELFSNAGGVDNLMKNFNPDWYYDEFVIADLILHPYVITSTSVINCEEQRITPESKNIQVECEIEGEPSLDSFTLTPSSPSEGEAYLIEAVYHCFPEKSQITVSIVGTDDYSDMLTQLIQTSSGRIQLWVPGAESGVRDFCQVSVKTPSGDIYTMTASLVFN